MLWAQPGTSRALASRLQARGQGAPLTSKANVLLDRSLNTHTGQRGGHLRPAAPGGRCAPLSLSPQLVAFIRVSREVSSLSFRAHTGLSSQHPSAGPAPAAHSTLYCLGCSSAPTVGHPACFPATLSMGLKKTPILSLLPGSLESRGSGGGRAALRQRLNVFTRRRPVGGRGGYPGRGPRSPSRRARSPSRGCTRLGRAAPTPSASALWRSFLERF